MAHRRGVKDPSSALRAPSPICKAKREKAELIGLRPCVAWEKVPDRADEGGSSDGNLASHFHHTIGWQAEIVACIISTFGKRNEQLVLPQRHAAFR